MSTAEDQVLEMLKAQKTEVEQAHTKLQTEYKDLDGRVAKIHEEVEQRKAETVEAKTAFQAQVEKTERAEADLEALNAKVATLEGLKGRASAGEDPLGALVKKSADQIKDYRGGNLTLGTMDQGAFSTKAFIATDDGSGNEDLTRPDRRPDWVLNPEAPLLIRDLIPVVPTTTDSVEWVKEKTFTNAAGVQALQGDVKPESSLEFELQSTNVITIAHWIAMSRQAIADVPRLQATVEGKMRYGLAFQEEQQILFGAGTGGNLLGIMPQAVDYDVAKSQVGDTPIDLIRRSILQSALSLYPCDSIVMNPSAWCDIELTKTDDKAYLFSNPSNPAQPRLWGRRVVESFSIGAAQFLTGGFSTGCTLYDREQTTVRIAEQHGDFFIRNLVAMLVEERIMLAVERPASFVKGTFA